jgi:hypothetical protein
VGYGKTSWSVAVELLLHVLQDDEYEASDE